MKTSDCYGWVTDFPASEKFHRTTAYIFDFCVCVMLFVSPIPHTPAIKSNAMVACLLIWIIRTVKARKLSWRRTPIDIPLLIFGVIVLISAWDSINVRYSMKEFKSEYINYTFVFFLLTQNVGSSPRLKYYWYAITASLASIVIYDFGSYIFTNKEFATPALMNRATSYFAHYSRASFYATLALPFVWAMIFYYRGWRRLAIGVLVASGCGFLLLTYTRASWLAVLTVAFFYCLVKSRKLLILFIALMMLSSLFLPDFITKRITSPEIGDRWLVWKSAVKMTIENPWTGIGYGNKNFKRLYPTYITAEASEGILQNCHNIFLQAGVEMGFPGLFAFGVIFIINMLYLIVVYRRYKPGFEKDLLLGIAGSFLAFTVFGQFAFHYENEGSLLFWVYVSMIYILHWGQGKDTVCEDDNFGRTTP